MWNTTPSRVGGAMVIAFAMTACTDMQQPEIGEPAIHSAAAVTGYALLAGNDWQALSSSADLRSTNLFSWGDPRDVYNFVDLVPDATFGKAVRITFPQNSGTAGPAPQMGVGFSAVNDVWVRFRIKFHPGWTTVGPDPAGHANSYKIAFITWENGFISRQDLGYIGTFYASGMSARNAATGAYYRYTETQLPNTNSSLGNANSGCGPNNQPAHPGDCDWHDGEWYEFVMHYAKTGANTAVWQFWKRRLTRNGLIENNAWVTTGASMNGDPGFCSSHPVCPTPRAVRVQLGVNKNKNNPTTMYLYWGQFEVVDGSLYSDPFNMAAGGSPPPPPPVRTLTSLVLTPATVSVTPGGQQQFIATAQYSDGTSGPALATYTAAGGTINANGLFAAGSVPGSYPVIATAQGSPLADTSIVTITAPLPTLQAIELTPASAALTAGDTVRFTARGRLTDGTYTPVAATFSATGGSISGTGLYTAGNVAGSYLAIAQAAPLADTAVISITAVQPPPPPPPGNYTPLLREGWRQASQAELQAAGYFSWSDSRSVYTFVSLVSDATFGQVVRLMQPAGTTASPRFQKSLPQSLSKAWFKYHVRFSPSWQIGGAGSGPAAYRLGEMRWSNHGQQAVLTIMGSSYRTEFAVTSGSTYLRYSETSIGSPGSLTTEFTGNDWWEYVSYYEQTAVTAARVHYWRRRLSASGTPSNWVYSALVVTGATTPTVGRIIFGWQKTRTTPVTQFVDLGPIEVVDGAVYPNPWGMPNL